MTLMLTQADAQLIRSEVCKRSLAEFVKRAWCILEPGQPLVWSWHMDAVCALLQAVSEGNVTRALINIPPGTSKSILVNVFWPAWEWGPRGMASIRMLSAAHEQSLAIRDTVKMRRLVTSEWYQGLWPVELMGDQNQKTYYENSETGFRQASSVESMTGKRGDRVVWDDPHSIESAISDQKRDTTLRVFHETLQTRLNNPDTSAIVIIMQRIHENDVAGEILEGDYGYVHLCLPMEFEADRKCVVPEIGFEDPRTEDGQLLCGKRFPQHVVDEYKISMGAQAYAGQMQQRPAPRSGGFFRWEKLEVVEATPRIVRKVRYWDKAGTQGGGAYTAGVLMGLAEDKRWYVLDVQRAQLGAPEREKLIKSTATLDGTAVKVWIEQEPGSGGKESAESTIRNLAGFTCKAENVTGAKEVRAEPYSVQVEAGNIKVLKKDWTKNFLNEHKTFPVGKYKDQVDAAAGAFNKLALAGEFYI